MPGKKPTEELEDILNGKGEDGSAEDKVPEKKEDKPTLVKVGDKEYTVDQLNEAMQVKSQVDEFGKEHGDWKSIYPEFTKRSQELKKAKAAEEQLAELKKGLSIQGADKEELPPDYDLVIANAKRYHLLTPDQADALIKKVDNLEQKLTKKESDDLVDDLKSEISEMVATHPFVKEQELVDYMLEAANQGKNLSVDEAAKLKYFDQFAQLSVKGGSAKLPETDTSTKGDELPSDDEETKLSFEGGKVAAGVEEILSQTKVE